MCGPADPTKKEPQAAATAAAVVIPGTSPPPSPTTTATTATSSLPPSCSAAKRSEPWKSSYQPLDPRAPKDLPTKGEIKAVIPKHCFERSYFKSMGYVARDLAMAAALIYGTSQVLSTQVPSLQQGQDTNSSNPQAMVVLALWILGWASYSFWMGTILWGVWVLAHECGHGAFSPSQTFNDVIGFILHQALLVPYFAWQYTHAKHHRRTNHLVDGESFVPATKAPTGLGPNNERLSSHAVWQEDLGSNGYAAFLIGSGLGFGWIMYLFGIASTGKQTHKGEPLQPGQVADHFRPNSPMFPPKLFWKIALSTVTEILLVGFLIYLMTQVGVLPVFLWYGFPYLVVNAWLVLYTWLHHTDPSVPHYGDDEWTWVKGALTTIDRPYGIFDFFHHTIGSTHVVHHLFHELPWYHADEATLHVKAFLEPQGLYNYDPTPFYRALWRVATQCHYVEDSNGVQYYQSLSDVPIQKKMMKNKAKQI